MSSTTHSTGESTQAQAELPKASPPESVPENVTLPITQYQEETGKPYIAKHLDGLMAWDNLDSTTQENGELIDDYFRSSVKSGKYRNDDVSYKDFIRHFEKVTDTKNAPLSTKINVIAEFLRYQFRKKQYES